MISSRCSCGFTETAEEMMADHLLAVFVPPDGRASDGTLHEEVHPGLTCSCGLSATTPGQLDAHFLRAFTNDDLTGRDGRRHKPQPARDR